MATPSRFFNDYVDLEGGDAFSSSFPSHGTTSSDDYPDSFAYVNPFGTSVYDQFGDAETLDQEKFEEHSYGKYSSVEPDPGYDSTTTGNNASTTPNTQASTRTASTTGSISGSRSYKPCRRHRHSQSLTSTELAVDAGAYSKKRIVGRRNTKPKSNGVEEEAKRNKFLERNRVAASKCRQKKKEWMLGLEDQKVGLESRHSRLQMEYNGLLGEVSGLKGELMTHANCKDPHISLWLENEARKFVQEASDKLTSSEHSKGTSSRRHSSISSGYQGACGHANIDPMLRSGGSSSATTLDDGITFSPTSDRDVDFEHASSTMFASGQ